MAQRYGADAEHARAVERTALRIYEKLAPVWALDRAATLPFLRWAAQLHETGLAISHNSYQKHSGYIVQNSDLQGFSQTDTLILAAFLRLDRGKFEATRTAGLPEEWREPVRRLAIMLRLAYLLHDRK